MSPPADKEKRKRNDTFNRGCLSDDEASSASKNQKSGKRKKNQSLSDSEISETQYSNQTTYIKKSPEGSKAVQEQGSAEYETTEMEFECRSANSVKTEKMEISETPKIEEVSKQNSSSLNGRVGISKDEASERSSESAMEVSMPTIPQNSACKNTAASIVSPHQRPRIMVRINLSALQRPIGPRHRHRVFLSDEEDISKATDFTRARELDMGVQGISFPPSGEVDEPESSSPQENDSIQEELDALMVAQIEKEEEEENEEKQK